MQLALTGALPLQLRHVDREGEGWKALPKLPRDAGQPWAQVYSGPKHVVFGHHARRRLQVRPYILLCPGLVDSRGLRLK